MEFSIESARKEQIITDKNTKKYFYGSTVTKEEWAVPR